VQAVWDLLNVPGQRELRLIDLGCGKKKQVPWAVGVDGHPYEGVDVVADLEKTLPFGDGEIDVVFASHVLEHVRDLFGLMNEIHRILAPGGALHALVPNARCVNAVANPTHVRFFNTQSFKFFCQEYPGLKLFRPGCVSADQDTVYADLYPVREGETAPADEELAYFFD
jgi:ubiquinone/menaquinone biosynthesis C-methylase UbiE